MCARTCVTVARHCLEVSSVDVPQYSNSSWTQKTKTIHQRSGLGTGLSSAWPRSEVGKGPKTLHYTSRPFSQQHRNYFRNSGMSLFDSSICFYQSGFIFQEPSVKERIRFYFRKGTSLLLLLAQKETPRVTFINDQDAAAFHVMSV